MTRDRNKPTQSWIERTKFEIEHEEELTAKQAYEFGKIRGKKETIDNACNVFCHQCCPHKYDNLDCLEEDCEEKKKYRKAMEE